MDSLYSGIKEDPIAKSISSNVLKTFSKEIVGQILTEVTGCTFFELQDKSMILLQRHLMAYHAKKAYQLKVHDARVRIDEQQRK